MALSKKRKGLQERRFQGLVANMVSPQMPKWYSGMPRGVPLYNGLLREIELERGSFAHVFKNAELHNNVFFGPLKHLVEMTDWVAAGFSPVYGMAADAPPVIPPAIPVAELLKKITSIIIPFSNFRDTDFDNRLGYFTTIYLGFVSEVDNQYRYVKVVDPYGKLSATQAFKDAHRQRRQLLGR